MSSDLGLNHKVMNLLRQGQIQGRVDMHTAKLT